MFREGYNCCQSVAGAFAKEIGLPLETVARLVSGFGGGMGRMREVCGAVSGMVFVAGALRGYSNPAAKEEKTRAYELVRALAEEFRQQNGSIICRELLGLAQPEGVAQAEARTETYYRKRPCAQLCHIAADLAAKALLPQTKE